MRYVAGTMRVSAQMLEQAKSNDLLWCRAYDVPPWIVLGWYPRPRFARLRWAIRKIKPFKP